MYRCPTCHDSFCPGCDVEWLCEACDLVNLTQPTRLVCAECGAGPGEPDFDVDGPDFGEHDYNWMADAAHQHLIGVER